MAHFRIFFSLLIILCNSCAIETTKPSEHQYINLASDCLTGKDKFLFKDFTHKTGIHVHIIHLNSEDLEERLKLEKTDSKIDAVILQSSYDALILEQSKLLHKIPVDSFPNEINPKYRSGKLSIIGLGFDPYVIIRRPEAARIKNYASILNSSGFCSDLSQPSDLAPFYFFIYKKAPSLAVEWIEDFNRKKIKVLSTYDTLIYSYLLFTKRSSFERKKESSLTSYKSGELIYPNQRIGGSYYDMPNFGIIKQAPNFSNSLALMKHLLSFKGNLKLNARLKTISYFSKSKETRFKRDRNSPLRTNKFLADVQRYFISSSK
jgi:hypothetical protein